MLPKSVANGSGGGSRSKPRPAAANAAATAAATPASGLIPGTSRPASQTASGSAARSSSAIRSTPAASGAKQSTIAAQDQPGGLLDVAVERQPLDHRALAPRGRGGRNERRDRVDGRLRDVVAQRAPAGDGEAVAAHPQGRPPDGVDELGVGVEHGVDAVPDAGVGGQPLAAAARGRTRRVDLVGRAADDHDLAGEALAHEASASAAPMVAPAIGPWPQEWTASVEPSSRIAGTASYWATKPRGGRRARPEHGPERGRQAGDPRLDLEAAVPQAAGEVRGAAVLLVRELGMRVHERDRLGDRRALRRDGGDHLGVVDAHGANATHARPDGRAPALADQRAMKSSASRPARSVRSARASRDASRGLQSQNRTTSPEPTSTTSTWSTRSGEASAAGSAPPRRTSRR